MGIKWSDLAGQVIDSRFTVQSVQSQQSDRATLTVSGDQPAEPLLMEVVDKDSSDFDSQRQCWETAQQVEHPNLTRILAVGQSESAGDKFLYCVKEQHDDELSAVLESRPLTQDEARQVLNSILPCLDHLHRSHLVHGSINPDHVLAFGDRVKLAADSIRPAGPALPLSDDVHAIGMLTMKMLTSRHGAAPDLSSVSAPLREVIYSCLDATKRQTLTPAGIMQMLSGPVSRPAASTPRAAPERVPPPKTSVQLPQAPVTPLPGIPESPAGRKPMRLMLAALGVLLVVVAVWALRKPAPANGLPAPVETAREARPSPADSSNPAQQRVEIIPAPNPASPKPAPQPSSRKPSDSERARAATAMRPSGVREPITPAKPAPPTSAADSTGAGNWAVIAATYSDYDAAQKRTESLRRQMGQCDCSVYPERGQGRRYYVLAGSGLTKAAAERLHRSAKASHLPPDAYVTLLGDGTSRTRQQQ
jgi:serine/threonine protein kinase